MLDSKTIEQAIIIAMTSERGFINSSEALEIRSRVASTLAAKKRHRERMAAPAYQWKKPAPRR